jgi:hypothetical protein
MQMSPEKRKKIEAAFKRLIRAIECAESEAEERAGKAQITKPRRNPKS